MKFTREVRHKIYKQANADSTYCFEVFRFGLCFSLGEATYKVTGERVHYDRICQIFPELAKHEPMHYGTYWFTRDEEGAAKRKAILEQCIEETQ